MVKLFEKIFAYWGELLVRRRGRVLGLSVLAGLLCLPLAIYALKHLDANILNQVSDRLPRFKALKETTTDFGGDTLAAVLYVSDDNAGKDVSRANLRILSDLLVVELSKVGLEEEDHAALVAALGSKEEIGAPSAWLGQVECKPGQSVGKLLTQLVREYPHAVLGMDELDELERRFAPEALQKRLKEVHEAMNDPNLGSDSVPYQKLVRDPLNLSEVAEAGLRKRISPQDATAPAKSEAYLISPDGSTALVLARCARSGNNVAYNKVLMAACYRAVNRTVERFRDEVPGEKLSTAKLDPARGLPLAGEPHKPGIHIGFTGLHPISVENERSMRKDIMEGTAVAFLALVVIFLVAYRSLKLTLNVTIMLVLASLMTLALAGLIRGRVGVLGAGFTSVLIGMGVDYAIMIYGTFRKLKEREGMASAQALVQTLIRRGPGVFTACMTTMIGFLAVTVVDFQAVAEFGLLTGIGLFASALLVFTFFPALLAPRPGIPEKPDRPITPLGLRTLGLFLEGKVGRWVGCGLCLVALVTGTGLLIFQPPLQKGMERFLGVRFDPDLGNLRSRDAQAFALRDRIEAKFGRALNDIRIVIEAPTEADVLRGAEEVRERCAKFVASREVSDGGSLLGFLPGLGQGESLSKRFDALDLQAREADFLKAAEAEFPSPPERKPSKAERAFKPFLDLLSQLDTSMKARQKLTIEELSQGPAAPYLARFAKIDTLDGKPRYRLVAYIYPSELSYTQDWLNHIAAEIEQPGIPGCTVRVTAARMVGFELQHSVIEDMKWIFGIVSVIVAILMMYTLRSIKQSLLAMIPLGFSFLFVLAGVALAERMGWDLSMNYINLMIFPILLGSAVDYGIYIVFDAYSGRFRGVADVVEETGHSLFLCCATTLGGYGSFVVGNNSGLISFGWAAILGYLGALISALVFLPALLTFLKRPAYEEPAPK